jgi:hypothetical protein
VLATVEAVGRQIFLLRGDREEYMWGVGKRRTTLW